MIGQIFPSNSHFLYDPLRYILLLQFIRPVSHIFPLELIPIQGLALIKVFWWLRIYLKGSRARDLVGYCVTLGIGWVWFKTYGNEPNSCTIVAIQTMIRFIQFPQPRFKKAREKARNSFFFKSRIKVNVGRKRREGKIDPCSKQQERRPHPFHLFLTLETCGKSYPLKHSLVQFF